MPSSPSSNAMLLLTVFSSIKASSPACTELEMNVMDWLAQMMGLPETFLHYHPGSNGGGILQSTVSESTLIALLAARKNKILEMKSSEPNADDSILNSRLIAYASDQAHSSVEKAGLISLVKMRFLPVDENFALRGETLSKAMEEDRSRGLVPIFVSVVCSHSPWMGLTFNKYISLFLLCLICKRTFPFSNCNTVGSRSKKAQTVYQSKYKNRKLKIKNR
uniref:Histidine decarboxylase n=1 Tax=Laticauda laticaudata TaxID=8630 RepID=A0A8C5SA48_LATLA